MNFFYFIQYLALGFVLFFVAGCGNILPLPDPDPLKLEAVTAVNSKQEEPFNNTRDADAPPELILKFSLSTNTDLAQYPINHGMTVENKKYFCDRKVPKQEQFFGSVYWGKYNVGWDKEELLSPMLVKERSHISHFIYTVYMKVFPFKPEEKDTSYGAENYTKDFNFWKKPEDVCVQIGGAEPMFGFIYFSTNIIRIPKEAIKAALDDYRKTHPDFVPPSEP